MKMSWARAKELARDHISLLFAFTCLLGIWTDPLFLYIPYLDYNFLCIGSAEKIKNIALVFRSLTDIPYLIHIIYHVRMALTVDEAQSTKTSTTPEKWQNLKHVIAFAKKLSWRLVLVDFSAVLPIPQVLILYVFYHPKEFKIPQTRMVLNILVLVQYVPRTYVIFRESSKYRKISPALLTGTFYFFMFILVGYVFGGMWYFSAIQTLLICYYNAACRDNGQCSNFYCNEAAYSKKAYWAIDNTCTRQSEWEGLYGDIMKSAYFGNAYFNKILTMEGKIMYFTWWGTKNLSNFGTNLTTTYDVMWENVFSILVCGSGLVLFAYLIGHMQNIMQSASTEENKRLKKIIKERKQKLRKWIAKHDIQITSKIKDEIREEDNVDLADIYCLPDSVQKVISMNMLERIPEFETMDPAALQMICDCLEPVMYTQKSFIFQAGEILDSMLFIVEGIIIIYSNADSSSKIRCVIEDGGVYGHKDLLTWASTPPGTQVSLENLPISTENVKCHTKVEGFLLNAAALKIALDNIKTELVVESPFHTGETPLIPTGSYRRQS